MLYTVTLNPTIDRSLSLYGNLIPGDLNRATLSGVCAGGKGINCARAASGMGGKAIAYTLIGKDNVEEFEKSTNMLSLEIRAEMKSGVTRTCIKMHNLNGMVTECNESGSKISANEMRNLMTRLLSDMKEEGKPTFLLLCGSVPAGTESSVYADMIALFNKLGVLVMLDCEGEALKKGIASSPYLVKPNLSELEGLVGKNLSSIEEIAAAAKELSLSHNTKVLVTIGGDGMIYADKENVIKVMVPDLKVSTTVGAGDTVLGVLAVCLERGLDIEKSLQLAAAAACAKVTALPGQFPIKKEVISYLDKIETVYLSTKSETEEMTFEEEAVLEDTVLEEEISNENDEEIVISEK